jgi:hypothetical protein
MRAGTLVTLGILIFSSHQAAALGSKRSATPNGDIFEQITIPNAKCGDGSDYTIYVREGDPAKVLVHMEGGGACWSGKTCFGKVKFTRLAQKPGLFKNKYLGKHLESQPFQDFTYVYVPYCTGDIHAGTHKAQYGRNTVLHYGRNNFTRTLQWIEENKNRLISRADDLVMYGESAGALGIMLNHDQVAELAQPHTRKLALVDSPGLHFDRRIWNRFSEDYLRDLDHGLSENAMRREGPRGILAPQFKALCEANPDWKFGVTQSTLDMIMSTIFGNITAIEHYFRVMGSSGLHQILKDPHDNCSAWIPNTTKHVFTAKSSGWNHRTLDGVSNGEFTRRLYERHLLDPHPSHH